MLRFQLQRCIIAVYQELYGDLKQRVKGIQKKIKMNTVKLLDTRKETQSNSCMLAYRIMYLDNTRQINLNLLHLDKLIRVIVIQYKTKSKAKVKCYVNAHKISLGITKLLVERPEAK